MGKNFSTIQSFVKNFEDLTLKQMFDVTAQLVNNQEELHRLDKIQCEKDSWKRLSLIGDGNSHQSSKHKRLWSSRILCCASEGFFNIRIPMKFGRTEIAGIQSGTSYSEYDAINGDSNEIRVEHLPRIHNVAALW